MINDWQRGKLPFFVAPPLAEGETPQSVAAEPTVKATFEDAVKKGSVGRAEDEGAVANEDTEVEKPELGLKSRGKSMGKASEVEEDLAAIEAEEQARLAGASDEDEGEGEALSSRDGEEEVEDMSSAGEDSAALESAKIRRKKRRASPGISEDGLEEKGDDFGEAVDARGKRDGGGKRKAKGAVAEGFKRGVGEIAADGAKTGMGKRDDGDAADGSAPRKRRKVEGVEVQATGDRAGAVSGVEDDEDDEEDDDEELVEEDDEEEDGDEESVEEDDRAMPSIGEGLEWEDLA